MLTLKNNQLTLELLDPIADQARFGTRYCTGGYIYQVHDITHGALMSGPTYPDSFNWFDGQGIPDAFNLSPLRTLESDPIALILGIGLCDLKANKVNEFCTWQIEQSRSAVRFVTRHTLQDWAVELERTVSLFGRTVRSDTVVRNIGRQFVPLRWFPHPFYPQLPAGNDELIKLNIPASFPASEVYEIADSGFISRKGWQWDRGYYQALDQNSSAPLVVIQRHPQLGQVTATCSYVPDFFPIWGNPITFSWEPFLERGVASGQEYAWRIDYDF